MLSIIMLNNDKVFSISIYVIYTRTVENMDAVQF